MLIVFDRETRRIVGHCGKVFDVGGWREPTLTEIFAGRDKSTVDAAYVGDVAGAKMFRYGQDNCRLVFDETGAATGLELLPMLRLRCAATDSDGDGVADLPADGSSATELTVSTMDAKAGVTVTFRTTRGALSSRTSTTDADGVAQVTLRAGTETVPVLVTASADGYRPGTLQLELVPPG